MCLVDSTRRFYSQPWAGRVVVKWRYFANHGENTFKDHHLPAVRPGPSGEQHATRLLPSNAPGVQNGLHARTINRHTGICHVNPNSNNIPSRNASDIQLLQCFVSDYRVAKAGGCSCGEHIEPARCDDADAEGLVTRIDQVKFRRSPRQSSFTHIPMILIRPSRTHVNLNQSNACLVLR